MKLKKKVIAAIASTLCFATMMSTTAYASGDVAGWRRPKHRDYRKVAGGVGCKQRCVPRN